MLKVYEELTEEKRSIIESVLDQYCVRYKRIRKELPLFINVYDIIIDLDNEKKKTWKDGSIKTSYEFIIGKVEQALSIKKNYELIPEQYSPELKKELENRKKLEQPTLFEDLFNKNSQSWNPEKRNIKEDDLCSVQDIIYQIMNDKDESKSLKDKVKEKFNLFKADLKTDLINSLKKEDDAVDELINLFKGIDTSAFNTTIIEIKSPGLEDWPEGIELSFNEIPDSIKETLYHLPIKDLNKFKLRKRDGRIFLEK